MKQFYILSFPRSGNTLMRTIIEQVFNVKTIGYNSEIDMSPILYQHSGYRDYNNSHLGIKRHSWHNIEEGCPVIFILRDFNEAINSHYEKEIKKKPETDEDEFKKQCISWVYGNSVYIFRRTEKIVLIQYDEIISGKIDISMLSDFIGIPQSNEFDFEKCKEIAREIYKKELEEKI